MDFHRRPVAPVGVEDEDAENQHQDEEQVEAEEPILPAMHIQNEPIPVGGAAALVLAAAAAAAAGDWGGAEEEQVEGFRRVVADRDEGGRPVVAVDLADDPDNDAEAQEANARGNGERLPPVVAPHVHVLAEESDDDLRMRLSPDERAWAWTIKNAIENDPELDNLSDFMYAQMALIEGRWNDLEGIVDRAHQLQAFRQEYKIRDSCTKEAARRLQEWMKICPGHLLSLRFDEENGNYIYAFDSTKICARTLASNPRAFEACIVSLYYILHATHCDFEAIRRGLTQQVECEGFDLLKNFGLKPFQRMWTELGSVYPLQFMMNKHFHTSMFKNLLVSMAKRFIDAGMHRKFQVGRVSEFGRLDRFYLFPNEEVANLRFEATYISCLTRRFTNEETFSL